MSNWTIKISNTRGLPYYYDSTEKKSSWDPPPNVPIRQMRGRKYLQETDKVKIFEFSGLLGQVRVSHLLVKHKGSRKPKKLDGRAIEIVEEQAIELAQGYLARINGTKGGKDSDDARDMFAKLAKEHSDCASGVRGGDLGWFDRGQMEAEFERAAYSLSTREISDIVLTASGVHLIMKTGGAVHAMKASAATVVAKQRDASAGGSSHGSTYLIPRVHQQVVDGIKRIPNETAGTLGDSKPDSLHRSPKIRKLMDSNQLCSRPAWWAMPPPLPSRNATAVVKWEHGEPVVKEEHKVTEGRKHIDASMENNQPNEGGESESDGGSVHDNRPEEKRGMVQRIVDKGMQAVNAAKAQAHIAKEKRIAEEKRVADEEARVAEEKARVAKEKRVAVS